MEKCSENRRSGHQPWTVSEIVWDRPETDHPMDTHDPIDEYGQRGFVVEGFYPEVTQMIIHEGTTPNIVVAVEPKMMMLPDRDITIFEMK